MFSGTVGGGPDTLGRYFGTYASSLSSESSDSYAFYYCFARFCASLCLYFANLRFSFLVNGRGFSYSTSAGAYMGSSCLISSSISGFYSTNGSASSVLFIQAFSSSDSSFFTTYFSLYFFFFGFWTSSFTSGIISSTYTSSLTSGTSTSSAG